MLILKQDTEMRDMLRECGANSFLMKI